MTMVGKQPTFWVLEQTSLSKVAAVTFELSSSWPFERTRENSFVKEISLSKMWIIILLSGLWIEMYTYNVFLKYFFNCPYNSTKTNYCRLKIEIKFSKTLYYFIYQLMHQWLEISSVAQSRLTLCNPTDCSTLGFPVQHHLQELTQTRPSSWWCPPTISSSVVPFTSCLQSFPTSGSFPVSQLFPSGGQSIGVSASASVLPMDIQDWFP